jgi:hypothetical protein
MSYSKIERNITFPTPTYPFFSLYLQQMPADERPIRGTVGAQNRRRRLHEQV